ncbi:Aste57867_2617 [Aphanomyces stellatus]|uniref:Aste57867_2617 protein n=1 Tax=Aphanomyces stellatus TaxID=120398 RepID=A0A485KC76_9STRA|nr:hypothetical protein As57867_002610 [Aphanomyces stellatus]VFT79813.1 Aste57867_2617 [Aphanomyces stellatus]
MRPFAHVAWSNAFSTKEGEAKKRKVKVGLVTGYTGTGYHGVQIQENGDVPTIEYDVREALFKAGCILESNYADMSKIGWSRSSRTDKGVHATAIVLSAKLLVHEDRIDPVTGRIAHLVDEVNAHLPDAVRVFSATKVHQSFRAREECILREYEYFLPVEFLDQVCTNVPVDAAVQTVLDTLPLFEGIHDFHNFTKQRRYFYKLQELKEQRRGTTRAGSDDDDNEVLINDDEVVSRDISIADGTRKPLQRHRRTIYSCRGTLVPDLHGRAYIRIRLTGASFLLNQIRCMVGAVIGVASGAMDVDFLHAALDTNHIVRVPTAPAEGLVLSGCSFGAKQHLISLVQDYNTPKNLVVSKNPNQAPHRVLLSRDELAQVHAFRDEVIYKEVDRSWRESENVAKWPESFASWMESLETLDRTSIANLLAAVRTNEREKAEYGARVVKEARETRDHVRLLPRAFATAVSIHYDLPPGNFVADVVTGLKKVILKGQVPADATQDDLFAAIDAIGLDKLAKSGRM